MQHRKASLLAVSWLFMACSAPPPPPTVAAKAESPGVEAKWSELRIDWDYGPCDPNDARSCHQSVRVDANGRIVQTETPNPGVSPTPKTRSGALSPGEMDELHRTIDAKFVSQMKAGFPCSQDTPDASTTILLMTEGKEQRQDATPCLREGAPPNQAARLVKLLEPYRFVH